MEQSVDNPYFNFETALHKMKDGAEVSRKAFGDLIKIRAQYPTETSMNTEPYLMMIKTRNEKTLIFPLDLSCESIFAEDWYLV